MKQTKKKAVGKGKAKKRLKRGVDWHAWAWKSDEWDGDKLGMWANAIRTITPNKHDGTRWSGKWVRVKFVEVPND